MLLRLNLSLLNFTFFSRSLIITILLRDEAKTNLGLRKLLGPLPPPQSSLAKEILTDLITIFIINFN